MNAELDSETLNVLRKDPLQAALTTSALADFYIAKQFPDNNALITSVDFDITGTHCITTSCDESLRIYDCASGVREQVSYSKKYGCNLAQFTAQPGCVAYASTKINDTVRYLSYETNQFIRYFAGHTGMVTSLQRSPNAQSTSMVSASMDGTVRLWNLDTVKPVCTVEVDGGKNGVAAAYDPSGTVVAVAAGSQAIQLYDVRKLTKGPFISAPIASNLTVAGLKFMPPTGDYILLAMSDGSILLLDAFQLTTLAVTEPRNEMADNTPNIGKGAGAGSSPAIKNKGGPVSRESGIVLSPAMLQQMRSIIDNHSILKREADNNIPFTNHMLNLVPIPAEFRSQSIENTAQASSYINSEASKVRTHLAVVQQVRDGTSDADAKRRLGREADMLESHIKQVKNFMMASFHSALSGNPAAHASSFVNKDAGVLKRTTDGSKSSTVASPSTPTATPLTPHVMGVKQRQPNGGVSSSAPMAANPNSTHVALSSALAHVATQSTRQSGPVDLDSGTRILSKRKIQALVSEIDPTERLEPDVEDILCDIADEFIESVTSFACQLAKHRKSDTLEAKDLQLHLERNWNIRIPGFASEEIRSVRKSTISQSHQEKLAAITNTKNMRKFD
ncbi:Transcription initiation factor TFIID subunit 12 [Coemansia sp. RSA 1972]|nr:Transcription initiation factor TFIID subunit 12 [Coemansia sp. RSA 1972]